jgi:hypothetical protein
MQEGIWCIEYCLFRKGVLRFLQHLDNFLVKASNFFYFHVYFLIKIKKKLYIMKNFHG